MLNDDNILAIFGHLICLTYVLNSTQELQKYSSFFRHQKVRLKIVCKEILCSQFEVLKLCRIACITKNTHLD